MHAMDDLEGKGGYRSSLLFPWCLLTMDASGGTECPVACDGGSPVVEYKGYWRCISEMANLFRYHYLPNYLFAAVLKTR